MCVKKKKNQHFESPSHIHVKSHSTVMGFGTHMVGEVGGQGRGSGLFSIQVKFAKKLNVDLQFSRKSIKQMSLKRNQIGTMVNSNT